MKIKFEYDEKQKKLLEDMMDALFKFDHMFLEQNEFIEFKEYDQFGPCRFKIKNIKHKDVEKFIRSLYENEERIYLTDMIKKVKESMVPISVEILK